MTAPYSTVEGIRGFVERGVEGLIDLQRQRRGATERLDEFVVLGRWWFTMDRHALWLVEQRFAWEPVVYVPDARRVLGSRFSLRGEVRGLPTATHCHVCERPLTLEQIAERGVHYGDEPHEWRHGLCHELEQSNASREYFTNILQRAGFGKCVLREIPNDYCKCELCMPWQLVLTPLGSIRIGRRKRVIHIDWSELAVDQADCSAHELFATEGVTKGDSYIHAWGAEKASEYLERLRTTLLFCGAVRARSA